MKNYPVYSSYNLNTVFDYTKMIELQSKEKSEIVKTNDEKLNQKVFAKKLVRRNKIG